MAYYGRLSVWYLFFIACTPKPTYTQLPSWEKLERESNKKSYQKSSDRLQEEFHVLQHGVVYRSVIGRENC